VKQDGTGSRTLGWPGAFDWPGGTAGVLTTAANAVDELTIRVYSSTSYRALLTKDWK
jgi:hypothetical protein